MRVEKGKVRAPEIGRVWLNSTPLSFRQSRGRVVFGVAAFAFTFTSCIDPVASALHTTSVPAP
jgi:hypothetical protein